MRQAGDIFLNGKHIGLYENGVTAYGIDITSAVLFDGKENVLAIKLDNTTTYKERATGTAFEWNANDFNPDHGGINRRVWLHVTGPIHQTLPLYYGLESQGVYVHAANFNIPADSPPTSPSTPRSATPPATAPPSPSPSSSSTATANSAPSSTATPSTWSTAKRASSPPPAPSKSARFWSPDTPTLYDVYTILTVNGKPST